MLLYCAFSDVKLDDRTANEDRTELVRVQYIDVDCSCVVQDAIGHQDRQIVGRCRLPVQRCNDDQQAYHTTMNGAGSSGLADPNEAY